MKRPTSAPLAAPLTLALGLALAPAAAAQADFMTAPKIGCVPDTVTRCDADNKCETRDASAKDKSEVLVIDFGSKKVSIRAGDKTQELGEVTDDKVDGEVRRFSVRPPGAADATRMASVTLTRAGKLTLSFDGDRQRAAATCSPES